LKSTQFLLIPLAFGLLTSLAQAKRDSSSSVGPSLPTPDEIVKRVGLTQKLDAQVPLDLSFRDETGKTVRLGQYFGTKPVMLILIQYRCRMLCSEEMNTLTQSLKELDFSI